MKRVTFLVFLCMALLTQAQTSYFTAYNFTVEPHNVGTVYNLVDTYYKAHKPEGVTVWLYENHFNDAGNNYTHSIVFAGSLDAMGAMYSSSDEAFQLFLTNVNAHIRDGYSAVSGTVQQTFAGGDGPFPFRRLFQLDVDNAEAFSKSFQEFNTKHNPMGRMLSMGAITMGRSPEGETHFVLVGFKDMKAAMAGVYGLVPENQRAAYDKAWDAHRESSGEVSIVRNSLMVVLGEW